jgi:hypothetical protein
MWEGAPPAECHLIKKSPRGVIGEPGEGDAVTRVDAEIGQGCGCAETVFPKDRIPSVKSKSASFKKHPSFVRIKGMRIRKSVRRAFCGRVRRPPTRKIVRIARAFRAETFLSAWSRGILRCFAAAILPKDYQGQIFT